MSSSSEENKEVSKAYREIIPIVKEWVRFIGYYHAVPGISMAIQQFDEVLLSDAFGTANVETKEKLEAHHLFRIASHSKMFTATAIMELYEADQLSPDDRVSKHLEWFSPKNDHIRIHHLLTHSSGLTRDSTFGQWYHDNFPNDEEFKEIISGNVEILDPSIQIKYSNIAYSLLGKVIEKVTGDSYESYMVDLCNRLGLDSTYPMIGETQQRHATGHTMRMPNEKRGVLPHVEAKSMNSATGFSSIPKDILKFYRAHMIGQDKGLKLSDYIKREMQRVQFKSKDAEWGYGFAMANINNTPFVGHGGGYPGFITYSAFSPEKELGIAVFTNTLNPPLSEIFSGIVSLLNYATQEYENYSSDPTDDFSQFEGVYRARWGVVLVKQFNGQLLMMPLTAVSPSLFVTRLEKISDNHFIIREALPTAAKGEGVEFAQVDGQIEMRMTGTVSKKFTYNY